MKHWTEDDFLHWLYAGSDPHAPMEAGHLKECEQCRSRVEQMTETRRRATTPPEISWDFLAAQRRSIYRRLGLESGSLGSRSLFRRWTVAMASLVCIVAISLTMLHHWTGTPDLYTSSDAKLFSDLASIEQSSEPRAIRPIHNLFQE